jgi:hypothetical protein
VAVATLALVGALLGPGVGSAQAVQPAKAMRAALTATTGCVNGANSSNLTWAIGKGRTTITVKPRHRLCKSVALIWASYSVPKKWDGKTFDSTAVPQKMFASATGLLAGTGTLVLKVALPSCGNIQVDLYYPPVVPVVASSSHFGTRIGHQLIAAWLWHTSTCGSPGQDVQNIQVTVPTEGSLLVSTPYTAGNPLDLGDQVLSPDGTEFSASGLFQGLSVVDTRNSYLPWTVSAQATDLSNGGTGLIDGQNVGLTGLSPELGSPPGGPVVVVTENPAASPAVPPGTPGTLGLGGAVAHSLLYTSIGYGTFDYQGLLTINAPTSTPPGVYAGTITVTII